MSGKQFKDPKIKLNKIYTRTGDGGDTRLAGGQLLPKDHPRIQAYGSVDELNAVLGVCKEQAAMLIEQHPGLAKLSACLERLQNELFNLGSYLSTLPKDVRADLPRLTSLEVDRLENEIDALNSKLSVPGSFVLPGGCILNAQLHLARTVCRRAERHCVSLAGSEEVDPLVLTYLNRLSDALFVWSRWVNLTLGVPEELWSPHKTSSGGEAG
ncbi:MAG: cob(I)yrinic acid a,c-diamide adenosyltransferase [FCB group bacterium]|nr:cob(I)yrinic acid a,c-diamide adenosyltransferase [FCB group bacterium]